MIESLLNNVDNNDIDYDAIDVRDSDKEDDEPAVIEGWAQQT